MTPMTSSSRATSPVAVLVDWSLLSTFVVLPETAPTAAAPRIKALTFISANVDGMNVFVRVGSKMDGVSKSEVS